MKIQIRWLILAATLISCALPFGLYSTPTAVPPTQTPAPTATSTQPPTAMPTISATPLSPPAADQAAGLLPEFSADLAVLEGATRYTIGATVDHSADSLLATISGTARIQYVNPENDPIEEMVVMLWPNNDQYRGHAGAGPALIDGDLVPGTAELGGLALRYSLVQPLAPGEMLDMSLPFSVTAEGPIGGSTPHRFGITESVLFAPTFYPILPLREAGVWRVEDAPPGGDTTNSLVAAYQVTLTVPTGLELVATGIEIDRQPAGPGQTTVTYVSGPARDFAFALGPFEKEIRQAGDVAVNGWLLPQHRGDFDTVMDSAVDQVELLNELVGPYPYPELDIVDVPGAYGGIEYPSLVTIGTLGSFWIVEPVVHEVAHQWFYGLIGDDQLREPWMDEAFATYAEAIYYEFAESEGQATGLLSDFRQTLRGHPDPTQPIGLGVGDYQGRDYGAMVYLKGALFYQELRQELGDDVFFEFLQNFFQAYRYGFASASDLHASAEATCGCELDDLFNLWVFEGGIVPTLE